MNLQDLGGKIYGDLEVLFHHPLHPIKDYHMWMDTDGKHTICVGSWPAGYDLMWFHGMKGTMVVNLCEERNQDQEVKSFSMIPMNVSIRDGWHPTDEQYLDVERVLDNNVTYIHCEQGHGRSGCVRARIRVRRFKWTPQSALQEALFWAGGKLEPNQKEWILASK